MSLYEGAMRRVRVDSELSEQCAVKWGCIKDLCCHIFFLHLMVDVVTEFTREGAQSELLHADVLVLMCGRIQGLKNKLVIWNEAIESKGLRVNLGKTEVMVSGRSTMDGMSKRKVAPCGVYSLRVRANSVVCLQCGKCIYVWCAWVQMVTPNFQKKLACRKYEGNIG